MNRDLFGKDRSTNVISFSYLDGMPGEAVGDIVISVQRAADEAREAGIPFYERFFGLIAHGLVHILGYDHTKGSSEARRMRYRERKLMKVVLAHPAYLALVDGYRHFNNPFASIAARYGHALLSGAMLALIQPPVSLFPLAFIALVPLLGAIDRDDLLLSFKRGFAAGVVAWLGIIYWVVVAMNSYGGINIPLSVLILFLFALYLSLYMAIFTVSCAYLEKRTSVPAYLLAAPVWVVLEYARGAVMTGFPWAFLGHSQYTFLPFIQVASITGHISSPSW